jgi:hypothetical protein
VHSKFLWGIWTRWKCCSHLGTYAILYLWFTTIFKPTYKQHDCEGVLLWGHWNPKGVLQAASRAMTQHSNRQNNKCNDDINGNNGSNWHSGKNVLQQWPRSTLLQPLMLKHKGVHTRRARHRAAGPLGEVPASASAGTFPMVCSIWRWPSPLVGQASGPVASESSKGKYAVLETFEREYAWEIKPRWTKPLEQ